MVTRTSSLIIAGLLLLAPRLARAEDVPPDKLAVIQAEEKKALAAVAAKYGNKPSSQLSTDERAQLIHDQQAAAQKVYDQFGVSAKDVARAEATLTVEERKQLDAAKQELASAGDSKTDKAGKADQKNQDGKAGEDEVEIIRGSSDEEPVEIYRDESDVETDRPDENGVSTLPPDAEIETVEPTK